MNSSRAEYQRDRRDAGMVLLDTYLDECADCGNDDPRVLQFDHEFGEPRRGPNGKQHSIQTLAGGNRDRLIAEVHKCAVRCANCHSIRHHGERRAR